MIAITTEDIAELQLLDLPNLIRMEIRNTNMAVCGNHDKRFKTSLRMRPSRIVGEMGVKQSI